MAEHQTENLGVRGSIPFIGMVWINYVYYIYKTKNKINISNKLKNIPKFIFIVNINKKYNIKSKNILKKNNIYNYFFLNKYNYHQSIYDFFYVTKKIKYNSLYWLSFFLKNYLKQYIGVNLEWQFININLKSSSKLFIKVWRKTYNKYILRQFFVSPWYYLYILTKLYYIRDVSDFIILFKYSFKNYSIRQHKRFFYMFGKLWKMYYIILRKFKRMLGFRLYFKGKLGRKGSVRKSIIYVKKGNISFSKKNLRFNYKYFLVPTETGVVGCYISIFY